MNAILKIIKKRLPELKPVIKKAVKVETTLTFGGLENTKIRILDKN
jgi:hypothetical protein